MSDTKQQEHYERFIAVREMVPEEVKAELTYAQLREAIDTLLWLERLWNNERKIEFLKAWHEQMNRIGVNMEFLR